MACTLFLMVGTGLRAQTGEPIVLSYGDDVTRIEIDHNGYKLGSNAELVPYTGAYVLTGSTGADALSIYNGSSEKHTFDITFRDLTIQAGEWEGAVAISSSSSTDTIVLNLYSSGTSRVCAGNHTAMKAVGNKNAPLIINLSVLDGTLTLENQHTAAGGFAWSSDHNTTFNLVNTLTTDGASSFTNSPQGLLYTVLADMMLSGYGKVYSFLNILQPHRIFNCHQNRLFQIFLLLLWLVLVVEAGI